MNSQGTDVREIPLCVVFQRLDAQANEYEERGLTKLAAETRRHASALYHLHCYDKAQSDAGKKFHARQVKQINAAAPTLASVQV